MLGTAHVHMKSSLDAGCQTPSSPREVRAPCVCMTHIDMLFNHVMHVIFIRGSLPLFFSAHLQDGLEVGQVLRAESILPRQLPRLWTLRSHQQPRSIQLHHYLCLHIWVL